MELGCARDCKHKPDLDKTDPVPATCCVCHVLQGFELFSIRDKDIPMEVLELPNKNEKIITFAWEPRGHRFAIVHGDGPRPSVSIYRCVRARARARVCVCVCARVCAHSVSLLPCACMAVRVQELGLFPSARYLRAMRGVYAC